MPPAKPARKRARDAGPKRTAQCHTCNKRIRIPEGWSIGPAVRRHYWAKHRDVMQADRKGDGR